MSHTIIPSPATFKAMLEANSLPTDEASLKIAAVCYRAGHNHGVMKVVFKETKSIKKEKEET